MPGGMTSVGNVMAQMPMMKIPTTLGEVPVYEARRSDSLAALATALVFAQKKLKAAPKDAENPFFNSRYADLGACMEVVKAAYNDEDISIIQRPLDTDGTTICIETILLHTSGEFISGILRLKPVKADPQGLGSCLTYARRYALGAITGLVTEEDDDGNAASAPAPKLAQKPPAKVLPLRTSAPPARPVPVPQQADDDDNWWSPDVPCAVAYLTAITQSKKLTAKGRPFGDMTLDLGNGEILVVTWFGFSEGWTFEGLLDQVCGTGRAVYFTVIEPSNPKYKPTLEHIHVEDLADPAE